MICPTCKANRERSSVTIVRTDSGNEKKLHFWDPDGVEHLHNPNIVVTAYLCTNGHQFAERSSWQCISCDYMACPAELAVTPAPPPAPADPSGAPPHRPVQRTPGVPPDIQKKRDKRTKGRR